MALFKGSLLHIGTTKWLCDVCTEGLRVVEPDFRLTLPSCALAERIISMLLIKSFKEAPEHNSFEIEIQQVGNLLYNKNGNEENNNTINTHLNQNEASIKTIFALEGNTKTNIMQPYAHWL